MQEQNKREDPQRDRRLLAARSHAFTQEVRIEGRKRNDHNNGEDCEINPKGRDGDRASRYEQCGGRGDHEQACLEISRKGHSLAYHFRGSEVLHVRFTPKVDIAERRKNLRFVPKADHEKRPMRAHGDLRGKRCACCHSATLARWDDCY